jgi:DNA-binding transcriptional MerR regulator
MDIEETGTAEPLDAPETQAEAPSVSQALDAAFDKAFGDEDAPGDSDVIAKPEPKVKPAPEAAQKVEEGDPKPEAKTDGPDFSQAPERFNAQAKEAWEAAPDAIKAEVHRALGEMSQGIEKYKGDASQWQDLAEFDAMAKEYGVTVKDTLSNYVAAENLLADDIIGGLDSIAQTYGYTLEQIAAYVMEMDPREQQAAPSQEVNALKQHIQKLEQQLNGVTTDLQSQRVTEIQSMTEKFASENPRFEELQTQMAEMIQTGYAKGATPMARLQDAYDKANRLTPAPQAPAVQTPAKVAQTRKGNLSVTGAPGSGSNPATRKAPSSAGEALDRAFDAVGL